MSYQIVLRIMILRSCIPDYCGNQGQVGNVIPENISVEKSFFMKRAEFIEAYENLHRRIIYALSFAWF